MVSEIVDQPKERLKMLLLLWKRKIQYFASLFTREVDAVGLEYVTDELENTIPKEHFLGFNVILN